MEGSSHRNKISIHPPREGWDAVQQAVIATVNISLHPPREGWDQCSHTSLLGTKKFQSTHPVRGGTAGWQTDDVWQGISIHPPREGWDLRCCLASGLCTPFQSTHPVRGGTAKMHKTSPRLMNLCDKNASEEALLVKQKHCFCKILHKSMRKTGANLPGFSRELAVR